LVRKFLNEEAIMKCVICKHGQTKEGLTTVTFDRDGLTLVVKEVPAQVCTNCGEDYVDEHVAHEILGIAERMAKGGAVVDVRKYVAGSAGSC
jgi:YgiT-type zinc finger domain-containing protein